MIGPDQALSLEPWITVAETLINWFGRFDMMAVTLVAATDNRWGHGYQVMMAIQ